jgi:hypothetical protein
VGRNAAARNRGGFDPGAAPLNPPVVPPRNKSHSPATVSGKYRKRSNSPYPFGYRPSTKVCFVEKPFLTFLNLHNTCRVTLS